MSKLQSATIQFSDFPTVTQRSYEHRSSTGCRSARASALLLRAKAWRPGVQKRGEMSECGHQQIFETQTLTMNTQQTAVNFGSSSKPAAKGVGMAIAGIGAGIMIGLSGYSSAAGSGFSMGTPMHMGGAQIVNVRR